MVTDGVEILVLDLLEWLSRRDRSYEETMEAWRTSCPKLPVWEDANDRGLICVEYRDGASSVRVTPAGEELLKRARPAKALMRPC
jgi:D-3-phosphoglycerate dehydrogenase